MNKRSFLKTLGALLGLASAGHSADGAALLKASGDPQPVPEAGAPPGGPALSADFDLSMSVRKVSVRSGAGRRCEINFEIYGSQETLRFFFDALRSSEVLEFPDQRGVLARQIAVPSGTPGYIDINTYADKWYVAEAYLTAAVERPMLLNVTLVSKHPIGRSHGAADPFGE